MDITIKDLYECRYEPDKLIILIERMYKNSLNTAESASKSINIGDLSLLLIEFKKQFPFIGVANQLAITYFVLWTQQRQSIPDRKDK